MRDKGIIMERKDDRTEAQVKTHRLAIVGTDSFMSGWGGAAGGTSLAAWAYDPAVTNGDRVFNWVKSRSDMKRVREVTVEGYHPSCAHLHIYVVDAKHPAHNF